MSDMVVVVPSRGRPQNIARLWDAWRRTIHAETALVVGLDSDDPQKLLYPTGPAYIVMDGMHQAGVTAYINYLALLWHGRAPYIGHIGDDNVPETPGWDIALIEALEKTPFAFANDLYPRAPGSLSCHVFMRDEIVHRLGYFGPPEIMHMYVDVAWMAWGRKCGITYLHDVIIDHKHFTTGKSLPDEVYQFSQNLIPADLIRWHEYGRSGRLNADIAKIDPQAPQYSPEELRQFNAELFIPEI